DAGGLATEFERDRRQRRRGGRGDLAADLRAAGEEDGVPVQPGESLADLGASLNHGDRAGLEVRLDQLLDELGARWSVFRRLDDRGASGRERGDQRPEAQLNGVVPG